MASIEAELLGDTIQVKQEEGEEESEVKREFKRARVAPTTAVVPVDILFVPVFHVDFVLPFEGILAYARMAKYASLMHCAWKSVVAIEKSVSSCMMLDELNKQAKKIEAERRQVAKEIQSTMDALGTY